MIPGGRFFLAQNFSAFLHRLGRLLPVAQRQHAANTGRLQAPRTMSVACCLDAKIFRRSSKERMTMLVIS